MFTVEASQITTAHPEQVWALYADVARWPVWDHGIEASQLDGAFAIGASGSLTPRGGQALPFTLVEVTPGRSFTDHTDLPGATIVFGHRLEAVAEGTRITHTARIEGPAAERYAQLFGDNLRRGVPEAVRDLARLAGSVPAT